MRKIIALLFLVFISTRICSKPVGLANCQNTCFQNAFIQIICQINPLIDILSKRQDLYPQNSLGYTFQHLVWDIIEAQNRQKEQKINSVISCEFQDKPTNLKKLTQGVYECLNIGVGSQADLAYGLNGLMKALKETSDLNLISMLTITKETTYYPSPDKPHTVKRDAEPFMLLEDFGTTPKLQHYINRAFVTKKKEWRGQQDVPTLHKFLSAPNFIGFVYRALEGQGFESRKKTAFPDELNFTRYLVKGVPTFYQLRAIGVHIPSGTGGHYFAVVRDKDGKLYNCNDATITQVTSWEDGIGGYNPAFFLYVLKPTKQDSTDLVNKLNNLQQSLQNLERFLVSI